MSTDATERKETSWSKNLETEEYGDDEGKIIADGIEAIERTAEGTHVNLVSHGEQGHPEEYLYPALEEEYGDEIAWEFVERCGCGGYVTRVHV